MSNVVKFFTKPSEPTPPQEFCIVCRCGCQTMLVKTTGILECSSCGETLEDDLTAYKVENVTLIAPPENLKMHHVVATEDLAFRKTLNKAGCSETTVLIVMNADGMVYTWTTGVESEEQIEWVSVRVNGLMTSLTGGD